MHAKLYVNIISYATGPYLIFIELSRKNIENYKKEQLNEN